MENNKALLLRLLGISPEKIAGLENGTLELSAVMEERIRESIADEKDTSQCAIVCQNILMDGNTYETLDAEVYIKRIEELKSQGGHFAGPQEPPREKKVITFNPDSVYERPFARYFARLADEAVYILIANLIFRFAIGVNPYTNTKYSTVWIISVYLLMLIIEPFELHFFGTTLGKKIFGVSISAEDGSKLSIKAAFLRTFRLLRWGYGLIIPFYNIFCLFRSFKMCRLGVMLPWDIGTKIDRPERIRGGRIAVFVVAFLVLSGADYGLSLVSSMPVYKAPMTEEQFYDNCARAVQYNGVKFDEMPEYELVKNSAGKVIGLTFEAEADGADTIYEYYYETYVAFLAFAAAAPESNAFILNTSTDISRCFGNCFESFEFDYCGMHVSNVVEREGYSRNIISNYLYLSDDAENAHFRQTFTITYEEGY